MHSRARERVRVTAAGLAFLVVVSVIAGCGGTTSTGSGNPSTSSRPTPPTGSETSIGSGPPTATVPADPATPPPSASASSRPGDALEVTIRLVGGLPQGGVTPIPVKRGQTVTLVGVSDTEDSLHVHGYDKTLEVHPGQRTTLSFVADVPGAFEIETHESEKLVAQLAVR